MHCRSTRLSVIAIVLASAVLAGASPANAASAREINRDVAAALKRLYATMPAARTLSARAKGILVFPRIVKAGLLVGGQYGEGALLRGGRTTGYYSTAGVSYGLQAGAQRFGYAMFFMTNSALGYLDRSGGWDVGSSPSVVVVDKGAAAGVTTTSAKKNIFVFFFNQQGLMAGLGLQGTKISKLQRGKRK